MSHQCNTRSRRRRLTALQIDRAKPTKKRQEIPDGALLGLYLVIQPSGRKGWCVRYRRQCDGKPRKLTLDGFPSLAVAHKLAREALDEVAAGGDPAADKQARPRVAPERVDIVDTVFRDFLTKHIRRKDGRPMRESTKVETARLLGLRRDDDGVWVPTGAGVLAHWRGRTLQSIRRRDVLDLLDILVPRGPVTANRTLSALRTLFKWHMQRDESLARSPCEGVPDPSPEISRERVLSDQELAALWHAAEADGTAFGSMVQLLILTGTRRDEARDAVWSEFSDNKRQWLIPGDRTKNHRDHLLPLPDAAIIMLNALPRFKGGDFLFTTTGARPITGLAQGKKRLHDAITRELGTEPPNWCLHDIRRTVITGLQKLGFPIEITEAVANHRSGTLSGVAKVYHLHDHFEGKQRALAAWADRVIAIGSGEPVKSNVVPMVPR